MTEPVAPIAEVSARRGEEATHGTAARRMFDRIAPTYDLLNRLMSGGVDRRWRARAVAEVADALPGPVLDLCAGTMDSHGRARPLAAHRSDCRGRLCAGDARSRAAKGPARGSGRRGCSGAAVRRCLIFGCPVRVRSSKPRRPRGGSARSASGTSARWPLRDPRAIPPCTTGHPGVSSGVCRLGRPALGGWLSGDRPAYDYLARSMAGFLTRQEYEHLLQSAGFSRVLGSDLTFGVASVVRAEVPS